MSQLKTFVLYPLLLIALVYAGVKAYIYYSVAKELDQAILLARPYADIRYQGIASDLRGSVTVEGVEVRSPQQTVPVRIAAVRLQGPGSRFVFDLAGGLGMDRIPDALQVSMERVQLPDMTQLLSGGFNASGNTAAPALQEPEECGLGWLLQRMGLMQSERYPLVLDLSTGYRFDVDGGSARLDFAYRVQEREHILMEFALSGVPRPGVAMLTAMPRLERATLSYRPGRDYVMGLVSRCAQARSATTELYLQGLLNQPTDSLGREMGFVPGAGLRLALQRFLSDPQEIRVDVGPIDQLAQLGAGSSLSSEQLLAVLNPRVSVNGEPVIDLSFQSYTAKGRSRSGGGFSDSTEIPMFSDSANRPAARFLPTPVADLSQYIGHDVRVYTPTHQRPVSGALISLQYNEANVEKRVHGGTLTQHVPVDEITRLEVRRYPPQPP